MVFLTLLWQLEKKTTGKLLFREFMCVEADTWASEPFPLAFKQIKKILALPWQNSLKNNKNKQTKRHDSSTCEKYLGFPLRKYLLFIFKEAREIFEITLKSNYT